VFGTTVRDLIPLTARFLVALLAVFTEDDDPDFLVLDGALPVLRAAAGCLAGAAALLRLVATDRLDAVGFFAAADLPVAGLRTAGLRAATFFAGAFFTGAFFTALFFAAGREADLPGAFFAATLAGVFFAVRAADFFTTFAAAFEPLAAADFARPAAAAFFVARPVRLPCAITTLTLLLGGPVL